MITGKSLFVEIISSLFILLFVYTGISKLIQRQSLKVIFEQTPIIGTEANFLSWSLPIMELIIALFLFFPSLRKLGLVGTILLMTIFTIYIGYMILFSQNLPCSCGGVLVQMTWNQHLTFNIFLTALAAIGLRIQLKNKRFIAINRQS